MASGSKEPANIVVKNVCKLCNRSAVSNTIQCQKCKSVLHRNCCDKRNLISDENKVVCCEDLSDLDESFSSAMTVIDDSKSLRQEIDFLKELLTLKDQVISDKCTIIADKEVIISLLNEEIVLLKEKRVNKSPDPCTDTSTSSKLKDANDRPSSTKITTNYNVNIPIRSGNFQNKAKKNDHVSTPQLAAAVLQSQTAAKCNEIINLANPSETKLSNNSCDGSGSDRDKSNKENEEWSTVVKKRGANSNREQNKVRFQKKIIGNNTSGNLKAVPKFVDIHVYRLHPETSGNALTGYLKSSFPEVICTQLVPKYEGQYASFKVSVYQNNFLKAMSADRWPEGACVSKFFHPRPRQMSVQQTI